ncbi:osteopontin [Cheilinus undulatus]|uniref:osteopontin n=1 Tax=Cheilinus undulatus TaxID=241271 RepID=UPI001BD3DA06|nr:osteopontin [Cheilinus undulatus]
MYPDGPRSNPTPNCDTMKVAVIFVLLFATVLCRPVRRPPAQSMRKQALVVPQARKAPVQKIVAAAAASSDESTDSSDEDQVAAVEAPVLVKSDSSATASTDTVSVNSEDSDDDDDEDETEESETEEEEDEDDESSDSSESGESSTAVPSTLTPVIITEEPVPETTEAPIVPTVVTDGEARGDSLGGYPSDYKTIIYVEDKSYHKVPAPYKSYEFVNTGKKMAYDMTDGNEVEKSLQVYKAIHVHSDILEEDTSTPEVESQGLDASSGTSQDQDITVRQASVPEEASASASDATTSESESSSSSTPEEEEEEESASTASDSTSTSEESEDEESQSSEEATATPGAADSDSDESESSESDSDEEGAGPDITTDVPVVITAK